MTGTPSTMIVFTDATHYTVEASDRPTKIRALGHAIAQASNRTYAYHRSSLMKRIVEGANYTIDIRTYAGTGIHIRWMLDGELIYAPLDYVRGPVGYPIILPIIHASRTQISHVDISQLAAAGKFRDMCKNYMAQVSLVDITFIDKASLTPRFKIPIKTTPVFFE